MFLFHWFSRRKQAASFDSWGRVTTTPLSQQTQDTRHYLENSDYQLPKDAEEDFRLNFQHHALYHALGNHFVAPIHPPLHTILDVGAGTGIWASEMAHIFPLSFVVGVDLSPISFKEPTRENCVLRVGNVISGLPFPDEFFSYTHQRLLVAGITAENWPRVVRELTRVTRENGWIELVEVDDRMQNAGPATLRMQELARTVSRNLGFDGEVIRHLGDLLVQEGLHSVEVLSIPIPVGEWAGRVGSMMKRDFLAALTALRSRYCAQTGLAESEFDALMETMAAEWEVFHPSCTFYAVYGRRVKA